MLSAASCAEVSAATRAVPRAATSAVVSTASDVGFNAATSLAVSAIGSAVAQPSVGVSIGINQPGVYGRVNIGDVPPPALILPQPVVIQQRR